jgi:hypothetical protein
MNTEPIHWSEEKQQRLQERLIGCWALDTWEQVGPKGTKHYLHFSLLSPALKTELKYALWYKFDSGELDVKKRHDALCRHFALLVSWLNQVAPTILSLLEKPLSPGNGRYAPTGKYPTKWTDLARKRATLPSILDTGTRVPGQNRFPSGTLALNSVNGVPL